jgi:hypothetical protein
MPKRKDENETAFDALQEILRRDAERDGIPQEPIPKLVKVDYRVEAGKKGGLSRARILCSKKRKNISRKAANARWSKK